MVATADTPERRLRLLAAVWVAVPLGLLNTAFPLSSLFLARRQRVLPDLLPRGVHPARLDPHDLVCCCRRARRLLSSKEPPRLDLPGRRPLAEPRSVRGDLRRVRTCDQFRVLAAGRLLMSWLGALIWVPGLSLAITFVSLLFP